MRLLTAFAQRLGRDGYLALDDVIVEQAYAKRLPWAGWTSSCAKQRKVDGLPSVVLLWCACDGHWCIPVGFRLWRPKRSGAAHRYRTKLELAAELLTAVVQTRLPVAYVVVDTPSTASWFTKHLARLGLTWQGTLDPKTHVVWRGQRQAVRDVAGQQQLTWRRQLGVRATALTVVAPKSGTVRLVVTSNRHGNSAYLVRNAQHADLTTLVLRKRSRWPIETVVHDSQQVAGLAACQGWMDQAMVRHVALVWVSCVVLQLRRTTVEAPVAAVKERWQLTVLRDGEVPPAPLRACPPELRSTA